MPDLFPAFAMPALAEESSSSLIKYPEAPLFDFESGDFVVDGSGRFVIADGHTAWVQWCQKAVMTERFSFLAYSTDYGSELYNVKKQPTRAAVKSEIERVVTETLLVDPRTEKVIDFAFQFEGDSVWVSFTVVPVIGKDEKLEVFI